MAQRPFITALLAGAAYFSGCGGSSPSISGPQPIPCELAVTFKSTAEFCDPTPTTTCDQSVPPVCTTTSQIICSEQPVTRARVDALNAQIGATVLNTMPGTQNYLIHVPCTMSLDDGIAFYMASGLVEGAARNWPVYFD